ncbi:hypothetical protein CR513_36578, partial [Mucuna pruriens]
MVNEVGVIDNLRLENQLIELTSLYQPSVAAKVCGICTLVEYPTVMCPTLQETESDHPESVGAIGDYQYGKNPAKEVPRPHNFLCPICTIGDCSFADVMLDLRTSINVMPILIYKSLNFGDLEPFGMTIHLANRSVVQPLGVLEDVLVQVNGLIFPANFYVLDMEDETSGKGSTLILG